MNRIVKLWSRVTEPTADIVDSARRRQAALLASLFLGLMIVGMMVQTMITIMDPPGMRLRRLVGGLATLTLVALFYRLSRTRYYIVVAVLFVLLFDLWVFVTKLFEPNLNILFYLLVPTLLSSILVSIWMTVLLTVVNVVGTLIVISQVPGQTPAQWFGDLIAPVVVVTALFLIIARHRTQLEEDQRAELAESEQRYRTLLESTYEAIVVVRDEQIVEVNRGFLDLFGVTLETAFSHPLAHFVPEAVSILPSRPPDVEAPPIETKGLKHGGGKLDLEMVVRWQDVRGRPAQVVALRDIAARKQAEEALRQVQRLDSLGLLAGGIAHDFNNMLTGVLVQSSLALRKMPTEDPGRPHVQKVVDTAERAAYLTRQLLAYAGRGRFEVGIFDINSLVKDSLLIFSASVPPRIEVGLQLSATPLLVQADRAQLQQVMLNLVLNGVEAIGRTAGQITIATNLYTVRDREDVARYINGAALPPGPYVQLTVRDTGSGMDEETISRIFDPFFTTKPTGHGLGLASTLGVMRSHRGAIAVESGLGRGTTFFLLLPLVEGRIKAAITPEPESQIETSPASVVLVVDDEAPVREALIDILSAMGLSTLGAANGHEGLHLFLEHQRKIQLVILDMHMPGMDGEQTYRALKAVDPEAHIILVSGYTGADAVRKLAGEHNTLFLQKPFDANGLMDKVKTLLTA